MSIALRLDAVAVCRERLWKTDWVIELDIRSFFDNLDHDGRALLAASCSYPTASAACEVPDNLSRSRSQAQPRRLPPELLSKRCSATGSGSGFVAGDALSLLDIEQRDGR
ncbi:hypothetical protein [Streptomyces bluensis]|uniref:Reverse transcriptase domain-containing protein n=1 Tax=Streptomyces bluensis TaxID=33897 RepID=A0ABW6UVC2_9ACTN